MKKRISIVTPLYNEGDNVEELYRRLTLVFDSLADRYDFEVIAVENGSVDDTYAKLRNVHARDPRWKIIHLSRNWLMEGGMTAGLAHARGDAAVIMASDLQDPPELIPRFIEKWEAGYENVYQVINRRPDESAFRKFATRTFYNLINKLSETPVPRNASDFRLVDRRAYEAFNAMSERNRMVRAMWGFLGFRSCGIESERAPRTGGSSKFKYFQVTGFAIRAILSYSYMPLKVIPFFGLACATLSFVLLIAFVVRALFYGVPFDGFGTITALMLMLFGFLFLFMGIFSEYIGMIYTESRRRPAYIIRELHGLSERGSATGLDFQPLLRPSSTLER
uniref:Putative glycosyltransferase n=1 Tax=uncultured organism TaxID=155900 RepID=A0A7L9QCB8_9ZZZZ|nr:putative glycosyltransferase [uncultured organism]